jgi:inhibitor of KinA
VAIGGSQTGVYPVESAGGWQIMGKSPVSFFDISLETPCFAKQGDEIVFTPVDMEEHLSIEEQVEAKSYELNKSIIND